MNGAKAGYMPTRASAHSGDDIGLVLEPSGVVTGHVYNEKREPVTRFAIDVIGPTSDYSAAPAPYFSRQFDSPDGSFRIDELPDVGVTVRATALDYAPVVSPVFKVEAGATRDVELVLGVGCALTGVVLDEEGAPLADVFVDAGCGRSAGAIGAASIDAASRAESDAEGRFRLEHVTPGDILVRAYDGSHAVSTVTTTIGSCEGVAPVTLKMSAGSVLTGVVRASDGSVVAGARVTLAQRSIGFVNTLSDSEGRYRFDKLPAGGMRVEATRGTLSAAAVVTVPESGVVERDLPLPAPGEGQGGSPGAYHRGRSASPGNANHGRGLPGGRGPGHDVSGDQGGW